MEEYICVGGAEVASRTASSPRSAPTRSSPTRRGSRLADRLADRLGEEQGHLGAPAHHAMCGGGAAVRLGELTDDGQTEAAPSRGALRDGSAARAGLRSRPSRTDVARHAAGGAPELAHAVVVQRCGSEIASDHGWLGSVRHR